LFELVRLAHGFVACKGGTGTLVELAVVWEMLNKSVIAGKPMVVLGDFWTPILERVREVELGHATAWGEANGKLVHTAATPADATGFPAASIDEDRSTKRKFETQNSKTENRKTEEEKGKNRPPSRPARASRRWPLQGKKMSRSAEDVLSLTTAGILRQRTNLRTGTPARSSAGNFRKMPDSSALRLILLTL